MRTLLDSEVARVLGKYLPRYIRSSGWRCFVPHPLPPPPSPIDKEFPHCRPGGPQEPRYFR
jgi:hypothetical protein